MWHFAGVILPEPFQDKVKIEDNHVTSAYGYGLSGGIFLKWRNQIGVVKLIVGYCGYIFL